MKLFFNSSLPRSGSSLLQNVLAQNPRFYCSPTSGVLDLLFAARSNFTALTEFKVQDNQKEMSSAFLAFCRKGMEGFYESITEKPVAVDKSRGWMHYYEWLCQFYHNPKVMVCIRDLRGIASSMEKLYRSKMFLNDPVDDPAQQNFVTVDQRVGYWMTNPPVGIAVNRLAGTLQRGNGVHFHFIRFEDFSSNPSKTMRAVYEYLEEPVFEHDFNNVQQIVKENDALHGIYGDHQVRPKVEPVSSDWDSVLGSEVSSQIVTQNRWFYNKFYP